MSDAVVVAVITSVPATIAAVGAFVTSSQVRALRDEWRAWTVTHTADGHGGSGRRARVPLPRRAWHLRPRWQWQVPDSGTATGSATASEG